MLAFKSTRMTTRRATKQLKELEKLAKNQGCSTSNEVNDTQSVWKLDWMDKPLLKEEVLSEYLFFLKNFPQFLEKEKDKIVQIVRTELKISEIEDSLSSLNFENLIGLKEGSAILDHLSSKLGQSLR